MSTHMPEFQNFFPAFLLYFVSAKLATGSIRIKNGVFITLKGEGNFQTMRAI